ncbi:asparaginase [Egibacter rhizosphaerae]|uniref:Asparaginase n=1 Tax=Egibacter rhizosphaerae TaxID=1670831 RepID=A0A411YGP4_9ACTN|nr:asparaginase [Egibacter rhizosphaerae]QBI20252.1 asparaginase [Egibacter rhizosphaerae]
MTTGASASGPAVLAVEATRDGFVEARHRAHVALATAEGELVGGAGDPAVWCYPRSAVKPLQAAACVEVVGQWLSGPSLAIACASHEASIDHQVEVAQVLALGGLDEDALGCPPAWPADMPAVREQERPLRLAHNCSGKHAAMAWAQTVATGRPDGYRDPDSPIQQRVTHVLAEACGVRPEGPGVDGCGAPAWRLPLDGLARAMARLVAAPRGPLARVREAMGAYPLLVGGPQAPDSALMLGDERVLAKRGAEGTLVAGVLAPAGPVGIAVKVEDGAGRAAGPVAAAALASVGARVPDGVRTPTVLGGGEPHGSLAPTDALTAALGL